ncbi:hypothetical protein [Streptomyces sp. G-G2]|uniref:hypothetical protein n=1 Tax=Streptomyces sp. G-G2 TaxID=3046201 RepID=UPI0024B93782|nr:hypothetical protein [Streptomyces sp. G-G2]MDJ0383053.1 hypothetical protein [Streptomyces sp. G-G2]
MAEADDPVFEDAGPTAEERAACDEVRRLATGMSHHESSEALEAAQKAAGGPDDRKDIDDLTRATLAEWERIADVLDAHGGPYTPDTDPFVQGQLAGRKNRGGSGSVSGGVGSGTGPGRAS